MRNRDDGNDSDTPFDDELNMNDEVGEEIDGMTLDTFNARYLSQTSPLLNQATSAKQRRNFGNTHSNERDRFEPTTTSALHDLTQKAYMHATGQSEMLKYSPVTGTQNNFVPKSLGVTRKRPNVFVDEGESTTELNRGILECAENSDEKNQRKVDEMAALHGGFMYEL